MKTRKTAPRAHKRTGLRKPLNYLKVWGDPDWTKRLTSHLSVAMVDEWLAVGTEDDGRRRKSWYIALTQDHDLAAELGPVHGLPTEGKTLLLFEDDVVALVQHLVSGELVFGKKDGRIFNGPADDHEEHLAWLRTAAGRAWWKRWRQHARKELARSRQELAKSAQSG